MSDIAIKVENLSKSYLVGHNTDQSERYTALRDVISRNAQNLVRKTREMFQGKAIIQGDEVEEFWALKDVSFEIKQGDRVGIIGSNGAGKSTLLKVLSRITEPTKGHIQINGRVASLLEVGTGFHPELTGRENIFLNGAILGMSRKEIQHKFDEIVDFAEVEKFLDTPVKRYSSGMYVRLAFAVAANLEPEILVVDEVLAVGDAQFQNKCLGKMDEVSKHGRTVLLVSHNMAAIGRLCTNALLLANGEIALAAKARDVIAEYFSRSQSNSASWTRSDSIPSSRGIFFETATITDSANVARSSIPSTEPFFFNLRAHATTELSHSQIAIRITNQESIPVFTTTNCDSKASFQHITQGPHVYRIECPCNFLPPGKYSLIIASFDPGFELYDTISDHLSFTIEDFGNHSTAMGDGRLGVVTPVLQWLET